MIHFAFRARRALAGVSVVALLALPAAAEPPTEQQLQEAIAAYEEAVKQAPDRSNETLGRVADEAIAGIELGELSLAQARTLMEKANLHYYSSRWRELYVRLGELAAAEGVDGAQAAVYRLGTLAQASVEEQRAALEAMLDHPALTEALREPALWEEFMNFGWWVRAKAIAGLEPRLVALGEHLPADVPVLSALGAVALFNAVAEADPDGHAAREPLRLAVIRALEQTLAGVDPADTSLAHWNFGRDVPGHLRSEIARLNGPAVRGSLLGGQAPELDILRVIGGDDLESLADLRGKVVVMDFWATWCGPCIASFPQMRELVERYEGLPVQMLGVTAIQGAHYGPEGHVDCKDDPEKEMGLMPAFMEWKEMNWPVVFSKQPVFNPQYDVRGIPHVVIIDAEGHVRARGLHPSRDHEQIIERIDGLLRDMGIKPPAAIAKEEPGSEGGA